MNLSRDGDSGFHVNVTGPDGEPVVIELSRDLVNWRAVEAGDLQAGEIGLEESTLGASGFLYFYRARMSDESVLLSAESPVLAGDTVTLRVSGQSGGNWEWSVNGEVGGNAELGTIRANPLDSAMAFFTAPGSNVTSPVTITGRNLDTGETISTTLEIEELLAELVVLPGPSVLGVGQSLQFRAGINVEGIGFIEFDRAIWKVNDLIGGTPELGTITLGGRYTAPAVLPATLPATIEVGYSLGVEQPMLGSVAINLVDLIVTPASTVRFDSTEFDAGAQPQLTATLHFSDGSTQPSLAGQTLWSSDLEGIASVDGDGLITIFDELGVATITAENTLYGVLGTAEIKARNPIGMWSMDAIPASGFDVNLESSLFDSETSTSRRIIEVTQPNVTLALDPRMLVSRQRFFNVFASDPQTFSGRDLPTIQYEGDDPLLAVYDQNGRIPQQFGIVARLEQRTGLLEFGDTPGNGQFTLAYDDGEWQFDAEFVARYTQLDLEASATGSLTGGTEEIYITEWADFNVRLLNPFYEDFDNGESRFVPRSPIEVTIEGADEFWVAYSEYVRDGTKVPNAFDPNFNGAAIIEKTDRFVGYVAPVYNPTGLFRPSRQPEDGAITFSVSPTRTGEVTYIVRHLLDPNVPEQRITVNTIQPSLSFDDGIFNYPLPPEDQLLAGGWLNLAEPFDAPNVKAIAFSSLTRWADVSPTEWVINRPDGETKTYLAGADDQDFKEFFDAPGEYQIQKRLRDRPEVATEMFVFTAPDLAELDSWPELNPGSHMFGGQMTPAHFIAGGAKILSPLRGVWKPGAEINVVLQSFDGAGNPGPIGYTVRTTYSGGPQAGSTDSTVVFPFTAGRRSGPGFQIETVSAMDSAGRAQYKLTFSENLAGAGVDGLDLFLEPRLLTSGVTADTLPPFTGERLYETIFAWNSERGVYQRVQSPPTNPPPVRVANYLDPDWNSLHDYLIRISGRGAIFTPSRLPIASQRVRDAVAAGKLPAGSEHLSVTVTGTEGFAESVGSGLTGVELGEGLALVNSSANGDSIALTLSTDLAYWDANPGELKVRTVRLNFGDESTWEGEVAFFRAALEPANENGEYDLPVNARYDVTGPVGAVDIAVPRQGDLVANLDLELIPSIYASWDADRDGVADPEEDANGDGVFDERDIAPGIGGFRGAMAASPIVGFSRQGDPDTGGFRVRDLTAQVSFGTTTKFTIFGNPTDRRTLRKQLGTLGEAGEPDSLPDFVSNAVDAETLIARSGGNAVDCFTFTAYNFTTEVVPAVDDPGIKFSDVNGDLDEAYERYSSFDLPVNLQDVAADPRVTRTVSVWVDHEATTFSDFRTVDPDDPSPLDNFLYGQLPTQFYAGMLDQYYQAIRTGPATLAGIGQDGRVRDYAPWPNPGTPTGTTRYPFGLQLDGVLYDSFFAALPTPRPKDAFFQLGLNPLAPAAAYAGQVYAANRLDVKPNSTELLGIPLVDETLDETGALNNLELLPRHGGASGGYVNLRNDSTPTFFVESALPGSHFPGLHGGYLIRGRPSQVRDPISEAIEDDIEDVSLMRNGALGAAGGTPPVEEDVFLGTRQPRRVLVYGSELDKKAPVETAVRVSSNFLITTDPPEFMPENVDTWKIKTGLRLTEKPDPRGFTLLATTQSDGDEEAKKIIADAVIDLTVDIIANAILNTITSGGYLAACGGGVTAKQVSTAALNLAVGLGENEMLGVEPGKKGPVAMALTGSLNGVETPVKGYSAPSLAAIADFKVIPDTSSPTGVKRFTSPSLSFPQAPTLNHCDLLNLPFNALKDAIKGQVTIRGLGGKGSAEAVGVKVLALCIPAEAQLNDGTFSAYASVSRRANIQPKELSPKKLSELPWESVWEEFPYADEVSDEQIMNDLYDALAGDPDNAEDIEEILRATGSFSLIREMDRESVEGLDLSGPAFIAQEQRETLYQEYKFRHWLMPSISLYVGPGHQLDEHGQGLEAFGDYQLTPHVSEIPVSYGVVGTAARTNENANARARLSHEGVEMTLVATVIQPPPEEE